MATCVVWFGNRGRMFQGGVIACPGDTLDFLEGMQEQDHFLVYLPSNQFPVMAWRPVDGCIEILEVYANGVLFSAEADIQVCYGPDGEIHQMSKGEVCHLSRRDYRIERSAEKHGRYGRKTG